MVVSHVQLLSHSSDIVNVSLDVVFVPLFCDDCLERACILDPFNQSSVATQRHDAVSAQAKASLTGLRVRFKHSVTENRELYKALFLAQITFLVALQQKIVNLLICPYYADFFWFFFGLHNCYFCKKALNADWVHLERRKLFLIFFVGSDLSKFEG